MGNFLAADFCMNLGHILASGKKDLFCIAVCLLTCLPLNLYWADEQAVWFEIRYIMLKLCKSVVWDQRRVSAKASAQAEMPALSGLPAEAAGTREGLLGSRGEL